MSTRSSAVWESRTEGLRGLPLGIGLLGRMALAGPRLPPRPMEDRVGLEAVDPDMDRPRLPEDRLDLEEQETEDNLLMGPRPDRLDLMAARPRVVLDRLLEPQGKPRPRRQVRLQQLEAVRPAKPHL